MTALVRSYPLPFGHRATFSWRDAHMCVEWEPEPPRIRKRRAFARFRAAYAAARRDFITDIAAMSGLRIMIVDTDGEFKTYFSAVRQ